MVQSGLRFAPLRRDPDEIQIRSDRGILLIGARMDPDLSLWRTALRQERPTVETLRLLRSVDRGDLPARRAGERQLEIPSMGAQPSDRISTYRLQGAIEDGRLAAVYLPNELTIVSAGLSAVGLPVAGRNRDLSGIPIQRLSRTQRTSAMLDRVPAFLAGDARWGLESMLTGQDLEPLSSLLVSLATPESGNQRVFMDAPLAGWAYGVADRVGLAALYDVVCAVRAAEAAQESQQLDRAARQFAGGVEDLGPTLLRVILLRRTRSDDAGAGEDIEFPIRTSTRRLQLRSSSLQTPEDGSDDFPDGETQAQALQAASQNGLPFCEICNQRAAT